MKIDIKTIKEKAKRNFEKTWIETSILLPKDTEITLKKRRGKEHPVRNMVEILRKILLEEGFDEIENLTILSDEDVYKQYGPEAGIILDRTFYLAKLPRPDIGINKKRITQIKEIIGEFDEKTLQEIFRRYKKGEIESDDLIEEMVSKLKIKMEKATRITSLFPEFKKLRPVATNLTLRSHMTATWYHTLAALQNQKNFPITLFSIGPRYRNEQKEDSSHLRVHHSVSIVIMDPNVSLDAGRKIVEKILKNIGFRQTKYVRKGATSKYYAANQEEEIFVEYKGRWFEIGDIGMYSPISLANFGIEYPVFNAGFGLERLVMVLGGYGDIRSLVYPQFHEKEEFSDDAIAKAIHIIDKPVTEKGREIVDAIKKTAWKYKNNSAPVEYTVWKGKFNKKEVQIKIFEFETGKKLIGPAGFNKVIVQDNNIVGRKEEKMGVNTGLDYITGIANKVAHDVENKHESFVYQVKMVRSLRDINLDIPERVRNYIKSNHKKIDIRGPVFISFKVDMRG